MINDELKMEMIRFADRRNKKLKVNILYEMGNVIAEVEIGEYSGSRYSSQINFSIKQAFWNVKHKIERNECKREE